MKKVAEYPPVEKKRRNEWMLTNAERRVSEMVLFMESRMLADIVKKCSTPVGLQRMAREYPDLVGQCVVASIGRMFELRLNGTYRTEEQR